MLKTALVATGKLLPLLWSRRQDDPLYRQWLATRRLQTVCA